MVRGRTVGGSVEDRIRRRGLARVMYLVKLCLNILRILRSPGV